MIVEPGTKTLPTASSPQVAYRIREGVRYPKFAASLRRLDFESAVMPVIALDPIPEPVALAQSRSGRRGPRLQTHAGSVASMRRASTLQGQSAAQSARSSTGPRSSNGKAYD